MQIRPEEISSIIKKQIESYRADVDISEMGTVVYIGDGIARIHGLQKAMASLSFPTPSLAWSST